MKTIALFFLFLIYLAAMLLVVAGYGLKYVVDLILTELVTGFVRIGQRIGLSVN